MTLRVLHVIDGLGTGGAERSLAELVPGLRAAGIESVVACFHRREGVGASLEADGLEIRIREGAGTARRAWWLRGLIRDVRPDLVHATLVQASLAARLAATGTGVPVLVSLVNTTYEPVRRADPNLRRGALRAVRALDGWTARHLTDHFHAITAAVREAAERDLRIDPDRITVIERGRDPDRLGRPGPERRARAREKLGLTDRDEVVLAVGRQEYQKGHRHLLEATHRLIADQPDLVVLIAGREGAATVELERQQDELGLGEHVRFLGFRADVPELLAAADLFAFPSLYEGLGGAVIEAMALGLPVVASDLPALREVIDPGGNADVVPAGDGAALAVAIGGLLAEPDRCKRYSVRSREIFDERFTVERSTARMIELYRGMVPG